MQESHMVFISNYDQAVKTAEWGTFGPNGDQPLKYVRLIDCSSEHLNAILNTQLGKYHPYVKYIKTILKSRE